ncbi:MAG: hypoxanthine phosphoribosyltransferase [Acidimicrobiales bacterium]
MSDAPLAPTVLFTPAEVDAVVARLAGELSRRYDDGVVLTAVLRGSVMFLADLVREMTIHPDIDFLAITPYAPGTGRVRLLKDLDLDIGGRDVVIVEDIVDTGLTSAFLRAELERRSPRSVAVCTLIDRPARRVVPVDLEFVGARIPDEFVIGFGLDHEGRYRNLNLLASGDLSVLREDPDAYVAAVYHSD